MTRVVAARAKVACKSFRELKISDANAILVKLVNQ
jgi:hypothetical protein